jgi:hypothetical protein
MVKFTNAIAFHCLAAAFCLPPSALSLIIALLVVGMVVSPPLLSAAKNFPALAHRQQISPTLLGYLFSIH